MLEKGSLRLDNPRLRAGAADLLPLVEQARRAGAVTLRELAAALTARGVPTPAGGGRAWHPQQVRRLLACAN